MIRRSFLSLLFGLVSAPAAIAAIRPEDVVPATPATPAAPTFGDFVNSIRPERAVGFINWADVDDADAYFVTVTDQSTGDIQTWQVGSRDGQLHMLTFSASRNHTYKVKVEAIYPDGSRRNAKQYDVDFAA